MAYKLVIDNGNELDLGNPLELFPLLGTLAAGIKEEDYGELLSLCELNEEPVSETFMDLLAHQAARLLKANKELSPYGTAVLEALADWRANVSEPNDPFRVVDLE